MAVAAAKENGREKRTYSKMTLLGAVAFLEFVEMTGPNWDREERREVAFFVISVWGTLEHGSDMRRSSHFEPSPLVHPKQKWGKDSRFPSSVPQGWVGSCLVLFRSCGVGSVVTCQPHVALWLVQPYHCSAAAGQGLRQVFWN